MMSFLEEGVSTVGTGIFEVGIETGSAEYAGYLSTLDGAPLSTLENIQQTMMEDADYFANTLQSDVGTMNLQMGDILAEPQWAIDAPSYFDFDGYAPMEGEEAGFMNLDEAMNLDDAMNLTDAPFEGTDIPTEEPTFGDTVEEPVEEPVGDEVAEGEDMQEDVAQGEDAVAISNAESKISDLENKIAAGDSEAVEEVQDVMAEASAAINNAAEGSTVGLQDIVTGITALLTTIGAAAKAALSGAPAVLKGAAVAAGKVMEKLTPYLPSAGKWAMIWHYRYQIAAIVGSYFVLQVSKDIVDMSHKGEGSKEEVSKGG